MVLDGPFPTGLAVVTPFEAGVASLLTVCVWPLCIAGLPQGSASRFSRESLRSRLDLEDDEAGGVSFRRGVED